MNKRVFVCAAALLLAISLIPQLADARDVGRFGVTYEIVEPDFIEMMKSLAAKVDVESFFGPKDKLADKIKRWKPAELASLPVTAENGSYLHDMTWELDHDIRIADGSILYPKGYKVNPCEFATLPNILVFIDGSDKNQLEWFKQSPYASDYRVFLLLTDGDWYDTNQALKRLVYYADKRFTERWGIKTLPSVAFQDGRSMRINQYVAAKKKAEKPVKNEKAGK